jgi:hypothetical protein
MLLGVLSGTADVCGLIQTTSTSGRFLLGWSESLFHDLTPFMPHWN